MDDAINELPIFCDNCATLALAELDDAPLCESCLMDAVNQSADRQIANRIAPLQFREPRMVAKSFTPFDSGFAT